MFFRKTSGLSRERNVAMNNARFIAGISLSIVMIYAFVRWLARVFTDNDDRANVRTEHLFGLLRLAVFCFASREVLIYATLVVTPLHGDESFIRLPYVPFARHLAVAFYFVSACTCLLLMLCSYLRWSSAVFDRASAWVTPVVTKVMDRLARDASNT